MKKSLRSAVSPFLVGGMIGVLGMFLWNKLNPTRELYPLQNEVHMIKAEFYLYYMANNAYPTDRSFLSTKAQNIIKAYPERFKWDEEKVFLHFKPEKEVELKTISERAMMMNEIGKPGETFEHNALVWHTHGCWSKGENHYVATEEEMNAVGLSLY